VYGNTAGITCRGMVWTCIKDRMEWTYSGMSLWRAPLGP